MINKGYIFLSFFLAQLMHHLSIRNNTRGGFIVMVLVDIATGKAC